MNTPLWARQLTPHEIGEMQQQAADLLKQQLHDNGCRCDRCDAIRAEIEKTAYEQAEKAKEAERARELQHLTHPFYKDADKFRDEVRQEQILKGAHKYPEPFNPKSWTPIELLRHAMQENVDQGHYIFGLYELLQDLESKLNEAERYKCEAQELRAENARLRESIKHYDKGITFLLGFITANDLQTPGKGD